MVLKVPGLYRVVFDNKYVRSFLPAVPGLSEWAMLGKAWFHTTETDERGANRFDVVLLDAPATGHGLDMLRVPKVILEVVPPGILRRDAETRVEDVPRSPRRRRWWWSPCPKSSRSPKPSSSCAPWSESSRFPSARWWSTACSIPLFSDEDAAS